MLWSRILPATMLRAYDIINVMKHLEEKIISTKQVYSGSYLKIEQDQVLGPDGKQYLREYIIHPGAAMMIPLLPNGNVVMVRQYRHAVKQVFLEFPAGKRDHGEDTLVTAQRELKEEGGYIAKTWKFLTTIHPVIGYSNEHIDLYFATDLTFQGQSLDNGEFLDVVEVSPVELIQWVKEGRVSDVKTQIGVFWLEKILSGQW